LEKRLILKAAEFWSLVTICLLFLGAVISRESLGFPRWAVCCVGNRLVELHVLLSFTCGSVGRDSVTRAQSIAGRGCLLILHASDKGDSTILQAAISRERPVERPLPNT